MSAQDKAKTKMQAAVEHYKVELKNLRTGRANPAILDNIMVEAYGSQMRLRDMATVTSPESRQLLITPFDASNASAIGKAIDKANIGLQPIVDGKSVRINVPPMDQNMRKEICKTVRKRLEDTKVSIRGARQECNKLLKDQKTAGNIDEDAFKKAEKNVQEMTDKFCADAEKVADEKEKEVMVV